jgi:hypothetical protein
VTESDFRIAPKQALAAKAKQALMIASTKLEILTYYSPYQLADPVQRASLRRTLAEQFNTGAVLPDIRVISITGKPAGGTFALTCDEHITKELDIKRAAAEDIKASLMEIPSLADVEFTVAGGLNVGYVVAFPDSIADAPELTASGSFTGGHNPAINVSRPSAVVYLVVVNDEPILVPENDVLPFTLGIALATGGPEMARKVSYRPEMLPVRRS